MALLQQTVEADTHILAPIYFMMIIIIIIFILIIIVVVLARITETARANIRCLEV
jgi:hypothetical protein